MRTVCLLLICYGGYVAQTALCPELEIAGAVPRLLPLLAAVVILWLDGATAVFWAGLLGLLSDSLLPAGMGIDLLAFITVALFLQQRRKPVHLGGRMLWMLFVPAVLIAAGCLGRGLQLGGLQLGELRHGLTALEGSIGVILYTAGGGLVIAGIATGLRLRRGLDSEADGGEALSHRWRMLTG